MDYRRNNGNELGVKQPCYGEYYCNSCNRRWESIKAWRDYEQECTRCKILVMPHKLEELFFYNCDTCRKYWKYKKTTGNDCRTCGQTVLPTPRSRNESQRNNRRQGQGQRGGDYNKFGGGGRSNNRNYNGNEERAGSASSSNSFNKSASNNDNFSDNESINSGHGNENNRYDNTSTWDSSSRSFNSSSTPPAPVNNENSQATRQQNHNYFQQDDEKEKGSWRTSSNTRRIKINPEELFYKQEVHSNQTEEMNSNSNQPCETQITEPEVEVTQAVAPELPKKCIANDTVEDVAEGGKGDDCEVEKSTESVGHQEKEVSKKPVQESLTIQNQNMPDNITNTAIKEDKKQNSRSQDKDHDLFHDNKNEPDFVSQLLDSKSSKISVKSNENDADAATSTCKDEKKSTEDDSTLKYIIIGSSIIFIGMFIFFKKIK